MPRDAGLSLHEDRIRLRHMLDAARRAVRIAGDSSITDLAADDTRLFATVKFIEIVGEASTKVSDATKQRTPMIQWRAIRLMRNRLIHGYDSVDVAIVHRTIHEFVPPLIADLEQILSTWPGG